MMNKKKLIIFGGNSTLVQEFLTLSLIKYEEITILSHRKYFGREGFNVIDEIDPFLSNTPPIQAEYKNPLIMEWGLTSTKLMNFFCCHENINKVIIVGSCISLIPFYNNSIYKNLKIIEAKLFLSFNYMDYKKSTFIFLPPINKNNNFLVKIFSDNQKKWVKIILDETNQNNRFLFPTGFLGLIMKFLFLIKKIAT